MTNENSIVMRYDERDTHIARDVVYFHGRSSSEREVGLVLPLFGRANVRSYRAPLTQSPGFAWFLNTGIGTAIPQSLATETAKVRTWIAADTGRRLPWLCGFSNGAAMAANLCLEDPDAYAGLIMLGGCFAVHDEALPPGRLAEKSVLFCRGRSDTVIPRQKFEQAQRYLTGPSGARTQLLDYDGGHELPLTIGPAVRAWLNQVEMN